MRLPNYSPSPTPMDIRPDLDFGLNAEIPSAWDQLSPFHAYLANTFASKAKNKGMLDLRLTRALQGESLEEQDAVDYQQTQATKARELAMQSMNMPDEEYERLKEDLRTEMSNRPSMPGRSPLRTPSTGALAAAGIGALLNPGFASSIAAAPFKEGLRQQAADDERAGMQFEVDTKEWSDRLRFLESQMDDARADRNTRIQAAIELAKMEDDKLRWMEDNKTKRDIAEGKGEQTEIRDAYKVYNDPKSNLANINNAAAFLRSQGKWAPDLDEATYVQRNKEAATAQAQARTEGIGLDNMYKSETLSDRVRQAAANADIAELKKIGAEFQNDILEVRAKYADDKERATISRLNTAASNASKAAAGAAAKGITPTSWFNAVTKYEGVQTKQTALADAYDAEANNYRRKAAILTTADPKEAARLLKAADALSAKAAVSRAEAKAAESMMSGIQQRFGVAPLSADPPPPGFPPTKPMSGGIGGNKAVPGKSTKKGTTPKARSVGGWKIEIE